MPFIDFTNPFIVLLGVLLFLLVLYLGREIKKAWVNGVMLFVFLGILIGHIVEFFIKGNLDEELYHILVVSIGMDLVFILLSFISYLWIDHLELETNKKKSIDDSLDWFWKKI